MRDSLLQSRINEHPFRCKNHLFIPASMLILEGIENSTGLRLKTLEMDRIPVLRFGVQSLDDAVGGLKPCDLAVLYGSRHTLPLSHMLAVRAQLPLHAYGLDSNVLFVDAGCSFDPHIISSFAQSQRLVPRDVLEKICVSRAFTAYQLSSLICDWLPGAIEDYHARLVIVSTFLELFSDLDIPREELLMSFNRLSRFLSNLALEEEVALLVAVPSRCVSPKRSALLRLLKSRADIIVNLEEKKNYLRLILERHIRKGSGRANISLNSLDQDITLQDFLEVKGYG